jgi:GH15 family glucan-1,4-alpha-glucosidase
MPLRIEDYALIGDCETVALVGRDGSIDWLCWPNFASPACFAALLGTPENGRWFLGPAHPSKSTRKYRDHTLLLETTFETDSGAARLTDFMLPQTENSSIVRIVRGLRGQISMAMELVLRFDYGRSVPWVSRAEHGALRAIAGPDMVVLRTPAPLHGKDLRTISRFTVNAGDEIPFVLTYGRSYAALPPTIDHAQAMHDTEAYWIDWSSRCTVQGDYAGEIERSLITLKALAYCHTGGIVAAPTTSLPEQIGGPRNWDYRFCWLRDATFTLLALMHGGYYEEARAWRDWLLRAVAGSPDQVQSMYGIRGERLLPEIELPWLPGYEKSKPVRIGNAAAGQLQLDVYGEVIDALFHAHRSGIAFRKLDLRLMQTLIEHLATIWDQPDEGIWETRGGRQQFTYSKVMAWVAFDRAIKAAECYGLEGPVEEWRALRSKIHSEVCEKGYNPDLGSFVQSYGSSNLDAALLLIPLVGFLPPTDHRVRGTIEAIEKRLMVEGFVLRYDTTRVNDGLPEGEGAFLACSFWMVSALKLIGRTEDARHLFERLLSLRNDVGLLAEEFDIGQVRQVGNFPQALSHIALVNAAFDFTKVSSPGQQRAESSPKELVGTDQPSKGGS